MVDFQTTSSKGGGDTVSFAHGQAFTIDHEGAPAALSLTLSGLGADGLPVAVRLPKAHLARGERLSAAPTNWRQARVGADPGHRRGSTAGPSTSLVRGTGSAGASPPSAGRSSNPRAPQLTLALRLKHPPKGAAISPVVEVLRGGKVVAKIEARQLQRRRRWRSRAWR